MAALKRIPPFLAKLKEALVADLKKVGVDAEVSTEPIPTTKLHRVMVLAPQFKAMKHSERQDLVWRIADSALSPDDRLRISMILTLSRDEAQDIE